MRIYEKWDKIYTAKVMICQVKLLNKNVIFL